MKFVFIRGMQSLKKQQFKSIRLLLLLLLVSSSLFAQVTVNVQNQSIRQILKTIEQTSGYQFFYNNDLSSLDQVISFSVTDASIETVMAKLLVNIDITYKKEKDNLIVLTLKAIAGKAGNSENRKVTGTIIDDSGLAVIGANVVVEGTTNGTITDMDGQFTLDVPENASLRISYIGYLDQHVKVGKNTVINVTFKEDTQALDEVVVVGYGSQKKVSMTSSVGVIKSDELNLHANNTVSAMQGLAPGLAILDRGGAPGRSNTVMRVRGNTSLNDKSNGALLLVDGIEQRIDDLNPEDIETVSVLKDASATSIYGSRAANGVILITTKRAKTGKVNVNYNYYYGIQTVTDKPEHMETETYMRQQNVAYTNAGRDIPWPEEKIREWMSSDDRTKYPLANVWQDAVYQSAPQQNHNVTVSGGNELIKGVMSLRYYDQKGIIPNFNSDIKEMRVNTDFQPHKKLKVSLDANYRVRYSRAPREEAELYRTMMHASQFTVPQYPDGGYGLSVQGNNPLVYANLTGDNRKWNNLFVGNLKAEYEILEGFKASLQYAIRQANNKEKTFTNKYRVTDELNPSRIKYKDRNELYEDREEINEYTLNALLDYTKSWKKHQLSALGGYSLIQNRRSDLNASRQDFYNNDLTSMGMGAESTMKNSGVDEQWALQSFFARANYNYDDRYLLEANIRYDGSSRFTGDNQYSFFPSFSAGWRVSNEGFWDSLRDLVSNFKLRASWGETGNQAVDLYSYYDSYVAEKYTFGDEIVNGYRQKILANKDLKWESTRQTDIGFDLGFLQNRLNIEFDYYNKRTDGILMQLPIPGIVGLDAPFQNAAVVDNKGFELSIGYRGGSEFTYSVNFNISNNKNKVVSLAGSRSNIDGAPNETLRIQKEGLPVNTFWGFKTDGLYQSEEEIKQSIAYDPNTKPGDIRYVDINDDGKIDADDRTDLGNEYPRFPFALNGNFAYKGFDLSLLIQGVVDAKTRVTGCLAEFGNYEGFVLDMFKDYWTQDNAGARFPRPQKSCDYNSVMSDFWVIDAGYIRLKNVELGYTIPKDISRKFYVDRLRFYMSGTNLLTFSKTKEWGLDPEFLSGRFNFYPQTSVYTFGVNVSF